MEITNFKDLRELASVPDGVRQHFSGSDRAVQYVQAMALVQIAQELNEIKQLLVSRKIRAEQIDIDHPAIDAGVDALFGQHPERGGQERRQAVFSVIEAALPIIQSERS